MLRYHQLTNYLRSLVGILELKPTSTLYQDVIAISDYLANPNYRIAVFAPFNHGKSTLLNALLGTKTLPMDLIPTTGTAIAVSYGTELTTTVILKNGQTITEPGIEILQQYAVLDSEALTATNRKIITEVAEVKIFCNHSWLKTGIEFLDLPGTNDRETENELVRQKLPTADLIIHVLDARKLMTLEEKEHLRDWLQNRGITTVIFVVNFLNLLTPEERQEVKQRLYFIAESFRSNLPAGVSNVYCVDALPALRARLKGDITAAKATGITSLESALHTIINLDNSKDGQLLRVEKVAIELLKQARIKQKQVQTEIIAQQQAVARQVQVKQKAAQLIQQGFDRSLSNFYGWLYLPKLLAKYQPSLAIALQETRFTTWLESQFKPEVIEYQEAINKWINQSRDFFPVAQPHSLAIAFNQQPVVIIPESNSESSENQQSRAKSYIPSELNFLLPKKAGAVVLGGANYLVNQIVNKNPKRDRQEIPISQKSSQIYIDAAEKYLQEFSDRTNLVLKQYEPIVRQYITFQPQAISINNNSSLNYQLQLLANLITALETEIQSLANKN